MAHFSNVGAHCSDRYCQMRDFLPFECSLCSRVFCLDHFKPDSHQCPYAGSTDKRVLVCPRCLATVPLQFEEEPTVTYHRHESDPDSCDPSKYAERDAARKLKCQADGCRSMLGPSNRFECRECRALVCLRHRFPEDHQCKTRQQSKVKRSSSALQGGGAKSKSGLFTHKSKLLDKFK
eukprot:GHVU01107722.1.p1 GENE.GHVU01107722.1~~GHVU01107722.1.p1  ORF type:complete len:178 (+),score=24.63 GHVU01107722.1:195-728(+)